MRRASAHLRPRDRRAGQATIWLLGMLGIAALLATAGAYWVVRRPAQGGAEAAALLHQVAQGHFEYYITENGNLESFGDIEIRCQVKSRGGQGTEIIKICPEGTWVQPGDELIRFDDSVLRAELIQQEITVANTNAVRIQAESDVTAAESALVEYVEGLSKQEQELASGEVFVAQENLRRAEEALRYGEDLAAKGYITANQLDADRFAVQKSRKDLDAALTKLKVAQKYTFQRMVQQLQAGIAKSQAQLEAATKTHELALTQLEELKNQIARCVVVAPQAGQVVYADQTESRRDERAIIEQGVMMREGQVAMRLPDPAKMQVRTRVNEARINMVRVGAPAIIQLEADPDTELRGVVQKVDDFPIPTSSWRSNIKEYAAVVKILDPTPKLRSGMRARVRVFVHEEPNVLQVPIDSVVNGGTVNYCLVRSGENWTYRAVETGPHNERFVVIRSGLSPGDQVAIDPKSLREITPPTAPRAEIARSRRSQPASEHRTAAMTTSE